MFTCSILYVKGKLRTDIVAIIVNRRKESYDYCKVGHMKKVNWNFGGFHFIPSIFVLVSHLSH